MSSFEVTVHFDSAAFSLEVRTGGALHVMVMKVIDVTAQVARRLERPATVRALQQTHFALLHGRIHAVAAYTRY